MGLMILKVVAASFLIVMSGLIAKSNPRLGGFILALPLTTLIALAFNYGEFKDAHASVEFAKSTFYAVPLSLLFFAPFLFADKFKLGFWSLYGTGIILLSVGYGIHKVVLGSLRNA